MNVLVFTQLFPNNIWPNKGVFIKERMCAYSKLEGVALKVVAPVPYFPSVKIGQRWQYSRVVKKEIIDGIEVTHPRFFMTPKIGRSLHGVLLFLSVLAHLKQIQKTFDFDLIDSHFVYPDGFAAVLLGKVLNKPVTISARGSDVNVYKDLRVISHLLRYALARANRVIAVSQALAYAIEGLGISKGKIVVIPNGVDRSMFFPQPKDEAREKVGLGTGKTLLSVGHLKHNKGFDLLMHALKILVDCRKGDALQLIIIGEGAIQGELEQLVGSLGLHDRVWLVGAIPHHQLRAWYNAADVFCLASDQEGWPNVIMESLACGTPVVATKAGGIPEIVNAAYLGILTDRNPDALAGAIGEALDRMWDQKAIAREAQKHTWGQAVSALSEVYRSVLVGSQGKPSTHPLSGTGEGRH